MLYRLPCIIQLNYTRVCIVQLVRGAAPHFLPEVITRAQSRPEESRPLIIILLALLIILALIIILVMANILDTNLISMKMASLVIWREIPFNIFSQGQISQLGYLGFILLSISVNIFPLPDISRGS